jgi:hypothetical protein
MTGAWRQRRIAANRLCRHRLRPQEVRQPHHAETQAAPAQKVAARKEKILKARRVAERFHAGGKFMELIGPIKLPYLTPRSSH